MSNDKELSLNKLQIRELAKLYVSSMVMCWETLDTDVLDDRSSELFNKELEKIARRISNDSSLPFAEFEDIVMYVLETKE